MSFSDLTYVTVVLVSFRFRVPVTFNYYLYVIRKRLFRELPKALSVNSSSFPFISFVLTTL